MAGIRGKGWLLVDLDRATVEPRYLEPARSVYDAPPLEGSDKTAPELDELLRVTLEQIPGGLEGSVVRLTVNDVPREVSRSLDHAAIRRYKARALQLLLRFNPPARLNAVEDRAAMRRMPLAELLAAKLASHPLPASVSRERFSELGRALLAEGDDPEISP